MRAWPAGIRSKPVGADCRRTMTTKTRLRWLVKERSGLGKRLSKQAVLRWWPPSKRKLKLLQRKERKALTEMQRLS